MLADAGLVAFALAVAVGLRLLYLIAFELTPYQQVGVFVRRDATHFLVAVPVVMIVSLICFWVCGFYTYSKTYLSRYKALVVTQGVSIAYLIFGFLAYFATGKLPISKGAFGLGWLMTVVMLVAARVWSDVWKKHVTPEHQRLARQAAGRHVLVIGGGGYIGSALIPLLLEQGIRVRLLDMLMFGDDPLKEFIDHPNLEVVRGDFRHVNTVLDAVQDVESVVHLGAIVGDPACSLDESLTIDVNLVSTRMIAELARAAGVERFVFASTCSVYGASDELLDERSEVRPVSLYGDTKRASEELLLGMASDTFSPVILRFATIYGLSGRTRFDLVVNLLTAKARLDGEITVHGGDQWRPFVHVEDAARAVAQSLTAPRDRTHGQVFNVGSNAQNYTITQVADLVKQAVVSAKISVAEDQTDNRNYRVSFNKIHRDLGFEPKWTLTAGIQQVLEAIAAGEVVNYTDARYSNAKYLTEMGTTSLDRDAWARQLIETSGTKK